MGNAESRRAYRVRPYLARHVNEGGEVGREHVCQGTSHAGLLCTALGPCALQDLGQLPRKASSRTAQQQYCVYHPNLSMLLILTQTFTTAHACCSVMPVLDVYRRNTQNHGWSA